MPARVLVYSATAGYRHDSIEASIDALRSRASSTDFEFDFTEDKSLFTDEHPAKYDAIVFLNNSGIVLDDTGKAALQNYLNLGGNFVGIHCAADALRDTPFFGEQIGAYFDYHPPLQESVVEVVDNLHPSTAGLPARWRVLDEMYNFQSDPRASVPRSCLPRMNRATLIRVKECSITERLIHLPGARNAALASSRSALLVAVGTLVWVIPSRFWGDELFLRHVLGGIMWALACKTTRAYNKEGKVGNPPTEV